MLRSSGEHGDLGALTYSVAQAADAILAELAQCGRARVAWLVSSPTLNGVALWDELNERAPAHSIEFVPIEVSDRVGLVSALEHAGHLDALVGAHADPRELLDAIGEVGWHCPQSFSVIALAEGLLESVTSPSITTLSWCAQESGVLLASAAIAAATGGKPSTINAPFELVRRESTQPGA